MANFLKPNVWKITLTLALFFVSSAIWRGIVISRISDTFPLGFPFQYSLSWGPCPPGEICSEFNGLYLIFDLVIWYVVSAWLIHRLRNVHDL